MSSQTASAVRGAEAGFFTHLPLALGPFLVADELDDRAGAEELAAESSGGGMPTFPELDFPLPCVSLAEPDAVTLVLSRLAVGGPWFASVIGPLGDEGGWFWTWSRLGAPSAGMDMISD